MSSYGYEKTWYLQQYSNQNLHQQQSLQNQLSQQWHIYNAEKTILDEVEKVFPDSALAILLTSPVKEVRVWAEALWKQRKKKKLMAKLKEILSEEEYKLLEDK